MSGEYEQIPESFILDLGAKRRELVEALKKNDTNLDGLVDHLYPDTAHLVFELLQNAEDKGATSARFELGDTKFSITHDGRPFSKKDTRRITNYGRSRKYEQEDTIGRFGIGFKSVFWCTEAPRIYSDTVAFEIVDRIVPQPIPRPVSSIRLSCRETVIELPFSSELTINGKRKTRDQVREEIRLGLAEMSIMSVLHLRCIRSIEWRTDDGNSGWVKRTELDDGVVQVDAKRLSGEDRHYFLRFREPYDEGSAMHLDVVFELEEKEQEQGALPVEDEPLGNRFSIVPAERGSVAVFFPASKETSNLRFHLHAPFIPELSRASIKEHSDNDDLFARLAMLVARSLPAVRDSGLLDRDFLGVLPNSQDSLSGVYRQFGEAVVRAMRREPLVPMHESGHQPATRLLQGRAEFKDFLGVDDIQFLMSGWDLVEKPYSWPPSQREFRRPEESAPDYCGWAVSATQRNTAVDRLLDDLRIDRFRVQYLVPPESETESATEGWIKTHNTDWHRAYYASVAKHWDALARAHDQLRQLPMVRTRSGEHRRAAECRFANDGDDAPEGVAIADPDTYSAGKGAKDARKGLERLGVREIDDTSKAVGILDKHYGESDNRPPWDEHRSHVERFIELVGSRKVAAETFRRYRFLLDSVDDWEPPPNLYAGNEYADSSAAPYYRSLERLHQSERCRCPVRYELHGRYRNIPGFDEFARRIGVAYEIPVLKTECQSNPRYPHLSSGGGKRWIRGTGIDDDWHVPCLGRVLQLLAKDEDEKLGLARAIWTALDTTERHILRLEARFRMNRSAEMRTAPSQLVATLSEAIWVPQNQDEIGLVFVKPRDARRERLPGGFPFDLDWAWIKATEFGEAEREQERQITEEKLDQEAKAIERTAMAKGLGFANSEEAEFYAGLPEEAKKKIRALFGSTTRPSPDVDKPPNPDRRRELALAKAREAPDRETEQVQRSVLVGGNKLKEKARAMLRARYEQYAHSSLCQVSGCLDRSFKLNDTWYFEAIPFLGLDKMSPDDFVALCPVHAAMYLNAKKLDGLKQQFARALAAGSHEKGITIPVVLAEENVSIFVAPKHAIDLGAALEVDDEKDGG